jgi:hypothetical protein
MNGADRHQPRVQHELLDVGAPVEALVRHRDIHQPLRVAERLLGLISRAGLGGGLEDALEDVLGGFA